MGNVILRCKSAGSGGLPAATKDVGDVPASSIDAAATLVFAAVAQRFDVVTWANVQQRLRPNQNRSIMLAGLELLRKHGCLVEVEVAVTLAGEGEGEGAGAAERARKRRKTILQMSTQLEQPIVAVKRSGQDSFPSFKMKPLADWAANDAVIEAIKAEHARRDAKRERAVRSSA